MPEPALTHALRDIYQDTSHNLVSGDLITVGNVGRDFVLQVPERITPALEGLPAPTRLFSGRSTYLDDLAQALDPDQADDCVAHVVTGMPGVGKTELVLQVAARALRREGWFPGGVLFVDLFGYDPERRLPPEQALAGFLRALGVPAEHVPAEAQERARLYATILRTYADAGRRLLVVLDNAAAAEDVRLLLPSDGATAVLITSRHALGVPGTRTHRLTELQPAEAVALLEDGLTAANGASDTRVADAPTVAAEIARLCGRLPLALQIVTALLADQPDRPLAAMARDLAEARDERLDELEREEAAVRTAFHLSYRRLDARQALLFRLLPLNPGPDVEVRTAAALLDVREPVARRTLEALHRAHLVERGAAYGRWRTHDLLRLYANEHGWENRERDGRGRAAGRLIKFYAFNVRDAEAHIAGPESGDGPLPERGQAIDWLEAELPNLVALRVWATGSEEWELVLVLALRLPSFFELRRHLDEWILTARAGLRAAKALGEEGVPDATLNLGRAFTAAGRNGEALPVLETAAELLRAADRPVGEANAANAIGLVLMEEGRLGEAYEQFSAVAALFARRDDSSSVAEVDVNRASCLARMGREAEGREMLRRAIAVFRREGYVRGEAAALVNLAAMSFGQEDRDSQDGRTEASGQDGEIGTCRRAIAVFEGAGDAYGVAIATAQLGKSLRQAGEHKAAVDALEKAAAAFHRSGERSLEAESLGELGLCFDTGKKYRRAVELYRRAETVFAELDDQGGRGRMLSRIAVVYGEMYRPEDALNALREAADAHAAAGDSRREAGVRLGLAEQLSTVGRLRESVRAAHRAALLLAGDENDLAQAAVSNYATTLKKARAAPDAPSIHAEALTLFTAPEATEPPDPPAPPRPGGQPDLAAYRARTLLSYGMVRHMRGESAQAEAYYEEAGRLFETLGNDHFVAVAANNLGGCLASQGKHEQALAACESALRRYRELAERDGEAQALMQLANPLGGTGRYEEAEAALREAIEIFDSLGDEQGLFAMNNLGTLYEEQGRMEEAVLWYGRSARGKCLPAAENLRRITEAGQHGRSSTTA
ncbi:ATP-binding protein [Streptomyces sp. GMY02]|uniref:tetratricopeptide repeat protein n=1 Tax=Streptomyces sp. GMY02 TaxID=1333528 RepID=UPI001C2C1D59|nr:tetratricopeptide repeat protein [Streptomyces sp. GMY02]QXE38688.1 ATP-binding protein [Streptomyces sp. GMY02]